MVKRAWVINLKIFFLFVPCFSVIVGTLSKLLNFSAPGLMYNTVLFTLARHNMTT